jgi:2-amino-4-hydroxy-6-hydroxymethyldihydropteridine diphosphokinase
MVTAYVAFGSNMDDRNKNIEKAIEYLKDLSGVSIKKISGIYETEPAGGPPQGKFLNGVIEIETSLLPDELLDRLKGVESRLGRIEEGENFPRPIDLDIIFYNDIVISGERIKIPHPRAHEREFVLRGLSEIAPAFVHPKLNKTVKDLYEELRSLSNPSPAAASEQNDSRYENNKINQPNAQVQQPIEGRE